MSDSVCGFIGPVLAIMTLLVTDGSAAQPVAHVFSVSGKVQIAGKDTKTRPAVPYGIVNAGDEVVVEPGAKLTLGFRDAAKLFKCNSAGTFSVTTSGLTPEDRVTVTAWPSRKSTSKSASQASQYVATLTEIGGVTVARSVATRTELAYPWPNDVVPTTQPAISWQAKDGASGYSVAVVAAGGSSTAIVWQGQTMETHAVVPFGKLVPAEAYTCSVTAELNGRTESLGSVTFRIATAEQIAALLDLSDFVESSVEGRSLVARWCEEQGMRSIAFPLYERLARETQQPVYLALLSRLAAQNGQDDKAAQYRKQAEAKGFVFAEVE